MTNVRAKKHLGQHFLKDERIAEEIGLSISGVGYDKVVEIGPGMGVMTKYLLQRDFETWVVELDGESVEYLLAHYMSLSERIIHTDFLKWDPSTVFGDDQFGLIGNFPYNISSQIIFRMLELRHRIPEAGGMFQREVAMRIASPPGNKDYGILSVLTQAYYDVTYLFTVDEHVFNPPPKVKSGVIHLVRKDDVPDVDEKQLRHVVKTAFNQRRKTLRNALKALPNSGELLGEYADKRAEQLHWSDFVKLTNRFRDGL